MREALVGLDDPVEIAKVVRQQVANFELAAHAILSKHETARSRVITVEKSRNKLKTLSVLQEELLDEALTCVSFGLFRAAVVAAWQAFIDNLEEKIASDGLIKAKTVNTGWAKFNSMDEVRESISEYQIIETAQKVGLLKKAEMKSLHGHLSTRNQCAHPSSYKPGLNEALGYVSELIGMLDKLQTRSL